MVDAIGELWERENIPDTDLLYMRVHRQYIDEDGEVMPIAFRNQGDGMSTDWCKYSSPEETKQRAQRSPSNNAVIKMQVGNVRQIPVQTVEHSPVQNDPDIPDNRAHTDVIGDKKKTTAVRNTFTQISTIVIQLDQD